MRLRAQDYWSRLFNALVVQRMLLLYFNSIIIDKYNKLFILLLKTCNNINFYPHLPLKYKKY